jgi:hypothetical protein
MVFAQPYRLDSMVCVPEGAVHPGCHPSKPASSANAQAGPNCLRRSQREIFLICGRRSGKSFVLALIAVWLACFHSYRQYLAPGERGTIFIVASDRRQARTILRYVTALLTRSPRSADW